MTNIPQDKPFRSLQDRALDVIVNNLSNDFYQLLRNKIRLSVNRLGRNDLRLKRTLKARYLDFFDKNINLREIIGDIYERGDKRLFSLRDTNKDEFESKLALTVANYIKQMMRIWINENYTQPPSRPRKPPRLPGRFGNRPGARRRLFGRGVLDPGFSERQKMFKMLANKFGKGLGALFTSSGENWSF